MAHPNGVHPLVVACGIYDLPDIAECDGWVVSLLNHGMRRDQVNELVARHRDTSGEVVQRVMAAQALKRHERARRAAEKQQRLLEAKAARERWLGKKKKSSRGAPPVPRRTIATSRPKRRAARAAGPLIAEYARIDQVTLPNGRFTHEQQQADADSLEDAADGWVDDQYAAAGEDEDQNGSLSGSQDEESEDDDWDPDAAAGIKMPVNMAAAESGGASSSSAPLSMDDLRARRVRHFTTPA